MKFDNVVIGGGLSGLLAGITLAKSGRRVAIIAAGQSTLHFSSGSFDLLGYNAEGQTVEHPFEAMSALPASHPYCKVGLERVPLLAMEAYNCLVESGLKLKGGGETNHYRMTPIGAMKPTWLTLDDYLTSSTPHSLPFHKVLLVNVPGYLDFPVDFIADRLRRMNVEVTSALVSIPMLQHRRNSPSEMRAANLAKVLQRDKKLQQMASRINKVVDDSIDAVLMPAIVGMDSQEALAFMRSKVGKPLQFIATIPPSVPGVRVQTLLRKHFNSLGGVYLLGNTVKGGTFIDGRLTSVETTLLPDDPITADEFVLATGTFQSGGLKSNYERVYEPIFGLDVDADDDRTKWTDPQAFNAQPYMQYGVHTNDQLQCSIGGRIVPNLYAVGSVLSGHNAIKQADGKGVAMITAVHAAKTIMKKNG